MFEKGASATDQSLIGTGRSLVVENNYGYAGPAATQGGAHDLARARARRPRRRAAAATRPGARPSARRRWCRSSRPATGSSTRTRRTRGRDPSADAWYLTALDFGTGRTLYKRLGGEGLGYNNNYAPVTLGPDGTAYVGTLGGLVALRDRVPPPGAQAVTGRPAARAAAAAAARAAARAASARGCG